MITPLHSDGFYHIMDVFSKLELEKQLVVI